MAILKLFERRKAPALPPVGAEGDGSPAASPPALPEMGFLDHLEELRWTLIKGLGGVLAAVIGCSFFSQWILDQVLLGPTRPDFFVYRWLNIEAVPIVLQNRNITGQFFAHLGTILAVGLVVGSPFFVYNLWRFVEPGLYPHERRGLRFSAVFATFFFALGIFFGYTILTPAALQFFAHYQISDAILNEFDINRYFEMLIMWAFGVGLLFELPVVVYFLAKLGLVTPDLLRKQRRLAIVLILIIAAFLTPPDPVSQIIVSIPLMGLYELSIQIAAVTARKREAELKAALE
jgi:sec-independent protein translocase protein TatC